MPDRPTPLVLRSAALACALAAVFACGAPKKPPIDPKFELGQKIRLAESYYNAGRVSEALDVLKAEIDKHPDDASLRNYYGQLSFLAGRNADAEAAFKKALEIDPYMTDAHNNLGAVYDATGRKQLAVSEYETALKDAAYPTPEKVHLNLGMLYESQGRMDEAIAELRRAVEINPKYYRGHYELASALDKTGKLDEAAREYEVAAPDYKSVGQYQYRLGLVYMKLNQPDKAREHFLRCTEISPGSEDASKAYDLLKMLP